MYYYRPHNSDTQQRSDSSCNQSTVFSIVAASPTLHLVLSWLPGFYNYSSVKCSRRKKLKLLFGCGAMARGSAMAAMAVLVLVLLGMCVHGSQALVCEKDFKEKGCNRTVEELFTADMFEGMFNHRNDRTSHAQNFWSYDGFITAAKIYQKQGFGSVGGDDVQSRELAAFFAHVAHETSCGWSGAKDGPNAWGLCYNQEMAPEKDYCKTDDLLYPCTPGTGYYGRGAFPLYWNYNYGPTGKALKQDLLNHPEILSQNETIAWQAAIWYWMTPAKTRASPHQVMTNQWVPTKLDTLQERKSGFGLTINIKTGDVECGHGDDPRMQSRISHYLYFLQGFFNVQDPGENLGCGLQGVIPLAYAAS